jgi:serpin B
MKKSRVLAMLLVLGANSMAKAEAKDDATGKTAAGAAFAWNLFHVLAKKEPGNIFFSPYSVSTALSMTAAGARGETADEMARVLGPALPQISGAPDAELDVANALWAEKSFKFSQSYLDQVRKEFAAGLENADFKSDPDGARRKINAWVEKKTHERIKNLLAPNTVQALTRLILVNAVYFKAKWRSPFTEQPSYDEPFFAADGSKADVSTMHQMRNFDYFETPDAQVLELPYKGDRLSMVVLLPKKNDGLAALEKNLSPEKLDGWLRGLAAREVFVALPKFRSEYSASLREALEALGMKEAFVAPSDAPQPGQADFSGMTGRRDLFVSAVIHKAFVAVDEEGTEAAAATAVAMMAGSAPRQPTAFRADHPFVYLIRDRKTGTILFLGRLAKP